MLNKRSSIWYAKIKEKDNLFLTPHNWVAPALHMLSHNLIKQIAKIVLWGHLWTYLLII